MEEATTAPALATVVREPRQRYRLVISRSSTTPTLTSRNAAAAWEQAVLGSGLPVVVSGTSPPRPRLVFAAALPAGASGEAELADLYLYQRRPAWLVREALIGVMPAGDELTDLYDVWLGVPALPGLVEAADWRITVGPGPALAELSQAAESIMSATSIPRQRVRGGAPSAYDLRPLVGAIAVDHGPPTTLRVRTLFHPERGVGRPDEVVSALGDRIGSPVTIDSLVREGLVLAEARPPRQPAVAGPARTSARRGRK